jgi:pPIWI_RE three-gene island domain Y/REase associating with pPIWI_RE
MEDVPRKSFRLTQHELTIHLIASGLVRLSEQVQRGEPITYPYPVALQRGLNRLLVACIQKGISPVQGVSDLLDWCRRPIHSWGLGIDLDEIDETDTLLDDQLPTRVCEDWACASRDVEAELSEQRLLRSVLTTCRAANAQKAYTEFRKLLISCPVLALQELQQKRSCPDLVLLAEHLREAYLEAPYSCLVDDRFYCCATCGNLLLRMTTGLLTCENERCRQGQTSVAQRSYGVEEGIFWLRRGLRRFVAAPGKCEMDLYDEFMKEAGLAVELWPMFDAYDLRLTFPDRDVWAIDVKDWANPFLLARRVDPIPTTPPWTWAYFVFPDDRRSQRSDYVRAFRNHCPFVSKHGKARTSACFARDLLSAARKKLQGIQGVHHA